MRNIFRRIAIVPFEVTIAVLAVGSGITGLLHLGYVDPVSLLLPNWEADALNAAFVLSGISLIFGLTLASAAIESAGLWLLTATVIARALLYGQVLHYSGDFVLMGVFDLAVIFAAVVRLWSIRTKHILLKTKEVIDADDLLS